MEMPGWKDAQDQFPHDGQRVHACYPGVYNLREVTFWRDGGGNHHFGLINEPDGKGSQPAKYWRPLPANAAITRERSELGG